jgi:hypothetical protein
MSNPFFGGKQSGGFSNNLMQRSMMSDMKGLDPMSRLGIPEGTPLPMGNDNPLNPGNNKVLNPKSLDTPLRERIAIGEVGLPASIFNKSDDEFSDWYKNKATTNEQFKLKQMGYNPEKNVFSPYRVTNAKGQAEDKDTSGIGQYGEGYGDRSAMDVYTGYHKSADKHIAEFRDNNPWLYSSGIDAVRLGVLEELAFNMGTSYAKKFPSMFAAIKNKKWDEAARQLKYANPDRGDANSEWFLEIGGHKNETGRANKLLAVLLTGNEDADPLISKKIKAKNK